MRNLRGAFNGHARWGVSMAVIIGLGGTGIGSAETMEYPNIPRWENREAVALQRTNHAMAWDGERVILFGGWDAQDQLQGNTWGWDGTDWVDLAVTGPAPRAGHAMTFDPGRHRVVLFGGQIREEETFGLAGDTWEWDGEEWSLVAATGPSRRFGHAMAHDPWRGRTVLFGGITTGGTRLGDTWEWDGDQWLEITAPGPMARSQHAMLHDEMTGRVLLYGGLHTVALNDMWAWDGSEWSAVPAVMNPPQRRGHAMIQIPWSGSIIMVGGIDQNSTYRDETLEWDGESWLDTGANLLPPRAGHAMAHDHQRETTLLVGGATLTTRYTDTWQYIDFEVIDQPIDELDILDHILGMGDDDLGLEELDVNRDNVIDAADLWHMIRSN